MLHDMPIEQYCELNCVSSLKFAFMECPKASDYVTEEFSKYPDTSNIFQLFSEAFILTCFNV